VHSSNVDVFLVVVRLWLKFCRTILTDRPPTYLQKTSHYNSENILFVASFKRQIFGLKIHSWLLKRVSIACYAARCISYDRFCLSDRLAVRPSVCHTLVSC